MLLGADVGLKLL